MQKGQNKSIMSFKYEPDPIKNMQMYKEFIENVMGPDFFAEEANKQSFHDKTEMSFAHSKSEL